MMYMETRAAGPPSNWFNVVLVCRTASLFLLFPSASVSCNVQRGAGDIMLSCVISRAPSTIVPGAVVDCKMISGTKAALCRRCISETVTSLVSFVTDGFFASIVLFGRDQFA
ncbi:hypothetical protein BDV26DRAFT_273214 [Aspergillus bertholletiae]|uniref:Secreted protein n=1 Tax=Aspergillus bertholletiae TaxID=1226010 RepID=A0A5N7ASP5_9EURO|nr:hypothetical protein BDV26DRAFT_273214 [Aspergillus bertholletiae]